jgi:hypothetical protein
VKTDGGQVDLVSRLPDGTNEKTIVLPFEGYFFIIKMCCFVIFTLTDFNFVNNYFNVCKNIGFH